MLLLLLLLLHENYFSIWNCDSYRVLLLLFPFGSAIIILMNDDVDSDGDFDCTSCFCVLFFVFFVSFTLSTSIYVHIYYIRNLCMCLYVNVFEMRLLCSVLCEFWDWYYNFYFFVCICCEECVSFIFISKFFLYFFIVSVRCLFEWFWVSLSYGRPFSNESKYA